MLTEKRMAEIAKLYWGEVPKPGERDPLEHVPAGAHREMTRFLRAYTKMELRVGKD